MSSAIFPLYEIGVLDYSRTIKLDRRKYAFKVENGKIAHKIDLPDEVPLKVMFRFVKNHKRAMSIGGKVGQVLFCHKVDVSYFYKKIEHLNLKQTLPKIEIQVEDEFVLNAQGELTLAQKNTRKELEKKYEIDVDIDEK